MLARIPESVDEWSYDTVKMLVEADYFETDTFDFKERLVNRQDQNHKIRLCKSACAFANTNGGFLIFGVKDMKSKSRGMQRIVGVRNDPDIAKHFGDQIKHVEPSIHYEMRNPPIAIPNSELVLPIVRIPPSLKGPHAAKKDSISQFYKRTNQGNEPMSYEEIRSAFVNRQERMRKLQLLARTAVNYLFDLQFFKASVDENNRVVLNLTGLDYGVLNMLISDLYTILPDDQELLKAVVTLRDVIRTIDNALRIFHMRALQKIEPTAQVVAEQNGYIDQVADSLSKSVESILPQITKYGIGGVQTY